MQKRKLALDLFGSATDNENLTRFEVFTFELLLLMFSKLFSDITEKRKWKNCALLFVWCKVHTDDAEKLERRLQRC